MNNLSFLAFALALLCVAAAIAAYEVRRYRKGLQQLDPDLLWASRSLSRFNKRLGTISKVHPNHE